MKRICAIHGLWDKTAAVTRCPKCSKEKNKHYDTHIRDENRKKFYNSSDWKKVRLLVLKSNPFCVVCDKPADTVDHIKAIKDGGSKLDLNNLQSMCKACHNIKEVKEGNRW